MYNLANSILEECKDVAPLSNLDTAIYLLRESFDRRPPLHPLHLDSLKEVAAALVTRFSHTNKREDLDEALSLCCKAGIDTGSSAEHDAFAGGWDDSEASELSELAKSTLADFNQSAQLSRLETAVKLHREGLHLRTSPHPKRLLSLGGLAAALYARFRRTDEMSDLGEAIAMLRMGIEVCPENDVLRADLIFKLVAALTTRFYETGRLPDLHEAVTRHVDSLQLTDKFEGEVYRCLRLSADHLEQLQQSGKVKDLEIAIPPLREGQALLPVHHPNVSLASLNNLAIALSTRFDQLGQYEDLDEAILFHREALELRAAPHPRRSSSLNNLAVALSTRFDQLGQREDLDEAILFHREALKLFPAPHPHRSGSLNNLANALRTRFDQPGQCEDLDEAILFYREALELFPAPHPDRSSSLNNLANVLRTRFDQRGQGEDLDDAILFRREALELFPAPHPQRSSSLNNLANTLSTRFDQSGQREDLDEAILFHREALELRATPHPHRSSFLNNLANVLSTRFAQSGQCEDLDEAILFHQEALELRAAPHPDRSSSLNNLAVVLSTRFDQSGQREDLDDAILFHREALELFPAPHPHRSRSLNNLANVLSTQFNQSGQGEDLDEAILFHREALKLFPAPHPHQSSSLNNLANALSTRFDQLGQREDLDEAILFHREALKLCPALHPHRSGSLNNLAVALSTRFDHLGQREDLDEAILFHQEALELRAAPHPDQSSSLNNLAVVLRTRFAQSGQHVDLDEAIFFSRKALELRAAPHPDRSSSLNNLAVALSTQFDQLGHWARHADASNHESALDAYQSAIELLPRLAMVGLDLQSRQQALTSGSDGLARDAAACAIRSGQHEKAVELLEAGRGVFWSQALQLRTPMTDLRNVAPKLAEKLNHISFTLERGSLQDVSRNMTDTPQKVMSMEKQAAHFNRLNREWLTTLEEVRQLHGFQDFLGPSRLSTLQNATVNTPVVILNASKTGCAALVLTSTGVQHVPLPALSFVEAHRLAKLIQSAITIPVFSGTMQSLRLWIGARHMGRASDTQMKPEEIFHFVLHILWASAIEPVIHTLHLQKSEMPPNLRWCPTGPFAFLPIHAAGIYHQGTTESVSDYVVSSYVPTIGALLTAEPYPTNPFEMMVVIQSQTLPGTELELQKIEARVPNKCLVTLGIPGIPASVERVVSHLSSASIAHFACHGQQNVGNPLDSALILEDGHLKVSRIMQQSMPNASLAFLCACETAMGDEKLPDEVIHLGATLLFAGFQGVVATMWSISDADGPKIADSFYEHLFKEHSMMTGSPGSGPDTTQAARGLHIAVAKLRSENASFIRWVPFIHLGR
ncbi:hypothetical protein PILCRDRAFT_82523 [Piloderma croceum F 1598]|uniref:CHAT domain-containing protein n=1 Tax=Piloderma croceum (strain F 1598) TaxID=765440 RepID=A0A0C3AD47_PILCF|nr:hypothetical protein PILCRDRAFT_82523 [Piloderma croceum F 1598]